MGALLVTIGTLVGKIGDAMGNLTTSYDLIWIGGAIEDTILAGVGAVVGLGLQILEALAEAL